MHTAHELKFDRLQRVGPKSATKTRPIVAKFHYYEQREQVRKLSFDASDALKAANLGVGAQIPKEIRDARKPLYPAMKQAKDAGKNVKFVGKKSYSSMVQSINCQPELQRLSLKREDTTAWNTKGVTKSIP